VLTVGCFPSVWFILADVSEPSVRYIYNGFKPLKMDLTEGSETSANINQALGKHPKVSTVNTEHSESLKSRNTQKACRHADIVQYEVPLIYRPVPLTRLDRCEGELGSMSV
jgi:hypothetical protein